MMLRSHATHFKSPKDSVVSFCTYVLIVQAGPCNRVCPDQKLSLKRGVIILFEEHLFSSHSVPSLSTKLTQEIGHFISNVMNFKCFHIFFSPFGFNNELCTNFPFAKYHEVVAHRKINGYFPEWNNFEIQQKFQFVDSDWPVSKTFVRRDLPKRMVRWSVLKTTTPFKR